MRVTGHMMTEHEAMGRSLLELRMSAWRHGRLGISKSILFMPLDSQGSLREQGVRLTRQRQILLDLIDQTGEHLDAERLYQMAKERDPKLNRVTVYRTLKMLKAGGLVDELDLMHYAGDQHYYETRLKQEHAH